MKIIKAFVAALVVTLFCTLYASAHNQVVVVPLSGAKKPLQNIITVAKQNGDYTDPVKAVSEISDASESNPYLVIIAPGVYELTATLVMQEYVSIAGAGQNATFLTGAISTPVGDVTSAMISGSSHATLSDLSVTNTGTSAFAYAVYNNGTSPHMERITAAASGATNSYAVYNRSSSSPTMIQVTATASGGSANCGVYNVSSDPTMYQVTATASGGTTSYGVRNFSITSILTIRGSFLSGSTAGVEISDPKIRIIDTRITGSVSDGDPGIQCRNTYDVNLNNVDC